MNGRKGSPPFLLALGCGLAALGAASAADAQARSHRYAIGRQDLGSAIRAFALASGHDVVFDPALARGKTGQPAVGLLTDEAALTRILAGQGLSWSMTSSGGFVIWRPAPIAPAEIATVEDVIVTASKRRERAREVPSSVTPLPGDKLQVIGAARLEDYVGRIPGLVASDVSMANGSTQLVIRGLTTGVGGNPTVGVYIDGSPFGSSTGFGGFNVPDLDPQDLDRVEVLRGPQGTLYGAGSLGGLLKYVTSEPDPSHAFARLEVDGTAVDGGGQGFAARASANVPVSDSLALHVSAYDRQDPGFVDNVRTGQSDINGHRYYGGRLSAGLRVNPRWKVRLSALYQSQKGAGPIVDYSPVTFRPTYGDLRQSRAIDTNVGAQHLGAYTVEIEGQIGGLATLTTSTAYDRQSLSFDIDTTDVYGPLIAAVFGAANVCTAITTVGGLDKFTQEIRLASPAEDRLSWLVGGFYTHERQISRQTVATFDPLTAEPITSLPLLLDSRLDFKFVEMAIFGDATYRFDPRFDVTGGVRYSHNDQTIMTDDDGLLIGGPSRQTGTSGDGSMTYLVTPRFHLNPDTMVYGRVATGYRPGGPNPLSGAPGVPAAFGPDKVANYEIGVKGDLFDHRLSFELAAYWIDWTNIQVQEITSLAVSYIDNAAAARSRGAEANLSWRPLPGLEVDANASYNDARLTQDLPAAGGATGAAGDRLPITPRWSGNLSADYQVSLTPRWRGRIGAEWRYVGETLGAFPNPGLPRFVHPAYSVVSLRAGISDNRWSLMIYARNIGDSRGQVGDVLLGQTRVSVIQPRTFMVSLARSF